MQERRSASIETLPATGIRLAATAVAEAAELRVSAVEPLATGPGPGVRYCVVLHGCPLRCPGCPDAEARCATGGRRVPVADLAEGARRHASYMAVSGGGVTVTGGEPLLQANAVAELLRECRALGLRTALDTAGHGNPFSVQGLLHLSDLLLVDITQLATSAALSLRESAAARLARMAAASGRRFWLMLTLIPGVTDDLDRLDSIAAFAAGLKSLERVAVLPLARRSGMEQLERCPDTAMRCTPIPTARQLNAARGVFRQRGLRAE